VVRECAGGRPAERTIDVQPRPFNPRTRWLARTEASCGRAAFHLPEAEELPRRTLRIGARRVRLSRRTARTPNRNPIQALRLPILAGPLRGRWWLPESRGKLLRIFLGSYEREQTRLFRATVRPGDTVLDVGAHVGYYTLLSAVLAGPGGAVWAFEPNPTNARFLRRHAEVNRLRQVHVEVAAVSNAEGEARFHFGTGSGTGHLAEAGALEVRTLRLDDFCATHGIAPQVVKIDVEGAEAGVLEGFACTVASARPVIFLSTHGRGPHTACVAWLQARGYLLSPIVGERVETATEILCVPGGA
jgi:FkbM family methyltransferase